MRSGEANEDFTAYAWTRYDVFVSRRTFSDTRVKHLSRLSSVLRQMNRSNFSFCTLNAHYSLLVELKISGYAAAISLCPHANSSAWSAPGLCTSW